MHRKITIVGRVVVHLTDKLPHGSYAEGDMNSITIYVPLDSTVAVARETIQEYLKTADARTAKNLNRGPGLKVVKVSLTPKITLIKCKGGVVTDEQHLSDLLDDGETLEVTIDQDFAPKPGCTLS
jgi:hypothetical protein